MRCTTRGRGISQDIRRVVRAEFLILGEDSDAFALDEMAERSLKQRRGLRRQLDDLIPARLAADPNLDLIAFGELVEDLGHLAVLVRELDELQYMRGHGRVPVRRDISREVLIAISEIMCPMSRWLRGLQPSSHSPPASITVAAHAVHELSGLALNAPSRNGQPCRRFSPSRRG